MAVSVMRTFSKRSIHYIRMPIYLWPHTLSHGTILIRIMMAIYSKNKHFLHFAQVNLIFILIS